MSKLSIMLGNFSCQFLLRAMLCIDAAREAVRGAVRDAANDVANHAARLCMKLPMMLYNHSLCPFVNLSCPAAQAGWLS